MQKKYDTTVLGLYVLDILGRPVSKIPEGGNLAYIEELRLTVAGTAWWHSSGLCETWS